MHLLILFVLSFQNFASVNLKKRSEREPKKIVNQVITTRQSKDSRASNRSNFDFTQIDDYLKKAENQPAIWDLTRLFTVKRTTTLRGRLLNSVVSTNLESPMVVELIDSNSTLPVGTIFSCRGSTKHKRIFSACDAIVLPDANGAEYSVRVSILNLDGSAGLKADYFYSGQEEMVAGVVASSFVRGVVENAQERVGTPLGQVTPDTVKNRYLTGVLSSTDELTSMMKQEMKTREPKAYIEAGKEVLIYFNERLEI